MSPTALGAVAASGGGAVALLVGWWLRDRGARRTEATLCAALGRTNVKLARAGDRAAALAEELAVVKGDLAVADQALEEYREAVPKAFDRGMAAGVHLAAHQLAAAAVERARREKARWN